MLLDGIEFNLQVSGVSEQTVTLENDVTTIGRSESCDISLDDLEVSRHHITLIFNSVSKKIILHDGKVGGKPSTNGTFVNNNRVRAAELKHGDLIQIGNHRITFQIRHKTDEDPKKTKH
jgi:pSer/pThr/pTyr-binding forkhead associated (FHA) protein